MGLSPVKRLRRFLIQNKSDLIFAKIEISGYFTNPHDKSLFAFAVMELGSNILKHAQSHGEIWLLERQNRLGIVACDRGGGIGNIELALQKGYTTFQDSSLGIGLSSLDNVDDYSLSIATSTDHKMHGSVVYFAPKLPLETLESLSIPFEEHHNGDFFFLKGQRFGFGDAAGHGKKASLTALEAGEFFNRRFISALLAAEFIRELHSHLINNDLRSCDAVFGNVEYNHVSLHGVGNLNLWKQHNGAVTLHSFHSGSIGGHLSKITAFDLKLTPELTIWITTDGILKEHFERFNATMNYKEPIVGICAALYFCASLSDDASILLITPKETP